MPPVGQNRTSGKGSATALSQRVPPDGSAGKNFSTGKPKAASVMASETVAQPGSAGTGASASAWARSAGVPGLTRKSAPASTACAMSSGLVTVPTPTIISSTSAMIARTASIAAGVRNVISTTFSPPARSARASGTASAARSIVTTGMTGTVISAVGSDNSIANVRSGEVAHQRQPRSQPGNSQTDRGQHIKRGLQKFAALVEQHGVEREGRERGVAAENAGGEEQPPVLRSFATLEREVAGEQAHHQRAGDVLDQGVPGEGGAEQTRGEKIDAVPQRRSNTAAEEYDDKALHASTLHRAQAELVEQRHVAVAA